MSSWINVPDTPAGAALLRKANPAKNPEEQEQRFVMAWARANMGRWPELSTLFHIPNGGWRSNAEAGIFKAMGVHPGVSDFFLPVPRYDGKLDGYPNLQAEEGIRFHGLWIEMKGIGLRNHPTKPMQQQIKLGDVSPIQMDWLKTMAALGHAVTICWDRLEGQADLERYLSGRWEPYDMDWLLRGRV